MLSGYIETEINGQDIKREIWEAEQIVAIYRRGPHHPCEKASQPPLCSLDGKKRWIKLFFTRMKKIKIMETHLWIGKEQTNALHAHLVFKQCHNFERFRKNTIRVPTGIVSLFNKDYDGPCHCHQHNLRLLVKRLTWSRPPSPDWISWTGNSPWR